MAEYMWCHFCTLERKPEHLDYSGYCVRCGTKAVKYQDNDGPLAEPEPDPEPPPDVEMMTMDGTPVPADAPRNIRWRRRLSLGQLLGEDTDKNTCGTCLFSTHVTDQIVSCPISLNRGAATHMDANTRACREHTWRVVQ